VSRGVRSPDGSTPIRPITGRPSLLPPSFTRSPVGRPYDLPTPGGGLRAYHVAPLKPRGLGPASSPVARHLRRASSEHPVLATHRFGPSLSAPLACPMWRRLRRFTWVDHATPSWSPTALVLAVAASARASTAIPEDEDTLSRGLRTPPRCRGSTP